jgi:glycerophosphoryl diester phosphodiesterase
MRPCQYKNTNDMKILSIVVGLIFFIPEALPQDPGTALPFYYVGHRGASYLAPENTMASIQLAWKLGAEAAECDIMLTADQQIVLFHDGNTKRLTGENLTVKESTWDQLKTLTIRRGENNLPEYTHETIPLLEEVLGAIPEDRMLVIEIKTGPEILPLLEKVIASHWKSGRISFIAFDFETIKQVKIRYPDIPCYYLSMFRADFNKHLVAVVESGLDGVDLRYNIINEKLMERCRTSGLDVWCWTVDDPETALEMKALGVSAVTTNRPAWLKSMMAEGN